jgi:hypothetical protein
VHVLFCRSLVVKHLYFLQLCDDIVHERTLVTVEQQLVLAALALQAEESGVEEGSDLRLLPHIVPARLYTRVSGKTPCLSTWKLSVSSTRCWTEWMRKKFILR